ncbi:carboxylesterase 1-like [Vigna unguiculata]|uniref:carboxylesterase 1-like n=1 Tax=Vigna unguiculata TaxID=3917 RepID=UPI001016C31E|nr:carboxylesterase 1-like [Vigna unguiculata]
MSNETIDPYHRLQILPNPDGTFTRGNAAPTTAPSSDPSLPISVLTKDITINPHNHTWLRLFLPRSLLSSSNPSNPNKLPLIIFFHGGGFVLLSAASSMFHDFCVQMADSAQAIVASVEYRLAPEHRLPAGYDDGAEALRWIGNCEDEWLRQYADYSKCYLMGNSAGATIAYRTGLRAVEEVNDLDGVKIQGLILRQPFFGGVQRTESELRLANNRLIPLCVTDSMWELALPTGADRDHEYCSVRAGNGVQKFEKMKDLGWRVLVSGNNGDLLVDRYKELAQLMEEKGVKVVKDFQEEGFHGVELFDPLKASQFIDLVKHFINPNCV